MKTIKNIDNHNLYVPFNFKTYTLAKGIVASVPDDLYEHLVQNWPLSFQVIEDNKNHREAKSVKTKVYVSPASPTSPMKIGMQEKPTFGQADQTPNAGTIDRDGVSWFGEGIEISKGGQSVN